MNEHARYTADRQQTPAYTAWSNMKGRVKRTVQYQDVSICEEWLDFQVFAAWFYKQHREEGWQLDKDILKKGNRIYCPEYCVYVPKAINSLILNSKATRGALPLGVNSRRGRYRAEYSAFNVNHFIGDYDTPEEAHSAYVKAKEAHIRDLVTNPAYGYAQSLDPRVITALLNWKVTT